MGGICHSISKRTGRFEKLPDAKQRYKLSCVVYTNQSDSVPYASIKKSDSLSIFLVSYIWKITPLAIIDLNFGTFFWNQNDTGDWSCDRGARSRRRGGGIPKEREVVVEPLVVAQLVLPLISKLKAKTRSSIVHPPQAFSAVSTSFQQAPSSQPMVRRSLSGAHTNVISGASKKKSTSVVSKLRK